jgi:formylglycine-generating enzyme required for sulfatase activity
MRLIAGNGFMRWPVANALTRGFVPWLASTLAGIGVEGPILTAIQHGLGQGTSSWGKDLLTNYKVMLGMRGVGEAATMFSRVLGIPQGIWQAFIHQASTLGGMSLTQDLSPTQMLMNLGYFHFSGALTYGILGKHVARWEQALEPSAFRPAASGPAAWRGDMGTALPRFAYATASAKEPMMKSLRPESRRVVLDLDRVYAKGPKGSSDPGKVGVSPPKMIRIPGGKFRMGSKDFKDSRTVRGVELDPFLLGETPVTNAQYLEHVKARKNEPFVRMETAPDTGLTRVVAVGANPEIVLPRHLHRIIAGWDPSSPLIQGGLTLLKVAKPDLFSAGFDEPNQPVVMVNWHEALAYAALTVKGGRLPTEAEWEYAARGPQGFEYGTRSGQLTKAEAHYDAPSKADVGSYPPNDFGLRDMTGNVWEWTGDWYQDSYQDLPNKNPIGPAHGIHKALRGGAWDYSLPDSLRAAHRHHYRPVSRFNDIGFRVAASVSQDSK